MKKPKPMPWRDPVLEEVIRIINTRNVSLTHLAERSGVSVSTLRNWINGKTRRPQRLTMEFAIRPMGYEMTIQRRK